MKWISVKDRLPSRGDRVRVLVPDLSNLMIGIQRFFPKGEYDSIYLAKRNLYCCNDPCHQRYHDRLHWSNNAGYYCTHWMPIPSIPKE